MDKQRIEAEARAAAIIGQTPEEACWYPYRSAEGMHWLACYYMIWREWTEA